MTKGSPWGTKRGRPLTRAGARDPRAGCATLRAVALSVNEPDPADQAPYARAHRRLVGIGIISLIELLQVVTQYLVGREPGRLFSHLVYLSIGLPILMGTFSYGFAYATRRRLGALATILSGVAVACVLGAGVGYVMWLLAQPFPILRPHPETTWKLARALQFGFMYGLANFALWSLAFVVPFAVEDARIRLLESDKLRLEADKLRTAAELARLRAHLEPHFLLNTLNAIAGLVGDDPREARRLLVCLGDLLRDALKEEDEMQTLDEQVRWLRRYAEILEARHAGQLLFRWQIAEESRTVLLPRLLLQPLVENAVKHGALRRGSEGQVTVRAELVGDGTTSSRLVCVVEDNGPGIPDTEIRSGAFGLHAVRRRLELRFTDQASLRLESSPSGTRSIVELPPQTAVARAS
jgi:signal transduction histidine kinase